MSIKAWLQLPSFPDHKTSHSNELLDITSTIQEGVSAIADVRPSSAQGAFLSANRLPVRTAMERIGGRRPPWVDTGVDLESIGQCLRAPCFLGCFLSGAIARAVESLSGQTCPCFTYFRKACYISGLFHPVFQGEPSRPMELERLLVPPVVHGCSAAIPHSLPRKVRWTPSSLPPGALLMSCSRSCMSTYTPVCKP